MLAGEMSFPDLSVCPCRSFPLECHMSYLIFEIEIILPFQFTQLNRLLQLPF